MIDNENKYIMALDEGTTSVRCIIYDKAGKPVSVAQSEFEQIFPKPGWVEQDAMEIWAKQIAVASDALLRRRKFPVPNVLLHSPNTMLFRSIPAKYSRPGIHS